MNLIGTLFTSKFVGTGPSCYKKNLLGRGLTKVEKHCHRKRTLIYSQSLLFTNWCTI